MAILIAHNVRSAHNVGSMFRTSDAAGIERIFLTGYTPGPTDPRGKERKPFVKVSLGAERTVPYSMHKTLAPVVKKLKEEGYTIVGVEQHARAKNIFSYKPKTKKLAVIMGNEVRGLSAQAARSCDVLVSPMHGKKESLNVSVACGIALFTLLR